MSAAGRILKPLLWIAAGIGILRFILSVGHAPRWAVYVASLTVVELAGVVYLALRVSRDRSISYLHLWGAIVFLFGVCQLLYLAGIGYTAFTGIPTLYHETDRLTAFLGHEPSLAAHAWMHVRNWMIIAPTLATWIIAAPIVRLRRWKTADPRTGSA